MKIDECLQRLGEIYITRLRSGYRSISAWALRAAKGLRPTLFLELILIFISAIYPSYQ